MEKGSAFTPDQCRQCWLFHHSRNKNLDWGGDGSVYPVPIIPKEEMLATWPGSGPVLACANDAWRSLKGRVKPKIGTHLKRLLSWMWIADNGKCSCATRAAFLDSRSPEWCYRNKDQILGWMEAEAKERGLPFVRIGAWLFVEQAIHNAEQEAMRLEPCQPAGRLLDNSASADEFRSSFLGSACPLWGKGFARLPQAAEGFRLAFDEVRHLASPQPTFTHQRGIAICGGGRKYFPGAYATIRVIRELGCDWPIELWHLGPSEREPVMDDLLSKIPNVTWRDGKEVAASVGMRCLGGWPLKAFALAYSDFTETVLLDADCYPVFHPQELLAQSQYGEYGAIFYPDVSDFTPALYDWFGVPRVPDNVSFESGQLVVDKSRHWQPTWLSVWLNHNSPYVYRHVYGDKDTFLLAWLKAGHEFAMPTRRPQSDAAACAFLHRDFAGRLMFIHRIHAKPQFEPWRTKKYQSDQRNPNTAHFPRDAWIKSATDFGSLYLSPPVSRHEPWLAGTIPTGGRTALDIGGNRGDWSSELVRRFKSVIAFEPQPDLAHQLNYVPKLDVRNVALWHEPAELTLHKRPGFCGQATVFNPLHWPEKDHPTITVQAVTLDSLNLRDVDFIKIDTEGAEANILRGGERTIRRDKPRMLIECHGVSNEADCKALVESWGYTTRHIANPITHLGSTWLEVTC